MQNVYPPLKYILWYHINLFDGEHTNKEWLRTPPHAPEVPQNQHKLDPGCLRNKMAVLNCIVVQFNLRYGFPNLRYGFSQFTFPL